MAAEEELSIVDLVKIYAQQETIGQLKGAGRWLGFGAAGASLIGLGLVLALVGGLRFIQSKFDTTFDGAWSWVPYAIVLAVAIVLLALSISRVKKATLAKE